MPAVSDEVFNLDLGGQMRGFKYLLSCGAAALLTALFVLPSEARDTGCEGDPCEADRDCDSGLVCSSNGKCVRKEIEEIVVTAPRLDDSRGWLRTVVNILLDTAINYLEFRHNVPMSFEAPGAYVFGEKDCAGNIIDARPLIFEGLFVQYDSAEVTAMGGKSWKIFDGYGTQACLNAN